MLLTSVQQPLHMQTHAHVCLSEAASSNSCLQAAATCMQTVAAATTVTGTTNSCLRAATSIGQVAYIDYVATP